MAHMGAMAGHIEYFELAADQPIAHVRADRQGSQRIVSVLQDEARCRNVLQVVSIVGKEGRSRKDACSDWIG